MSDLRSAMFLTREGVLATAGVLCPGAAAVLKRMQLAGVPTICVHNADPDVAAREDDAIDALLTVEGTGLTAWYQGRDRTGLPRPTMLLQAAQDHGLDLSTSWMITTLTEAIQAAAQAGCIGGVLIGEASEPPGLIGFTLNRAADLADAPRVMVPPEGGCWHDHR